MMNFLFGTAAGGIIACVVTIAAARHPDVQSRLGLIPSAQAALALPPTAPLEKRCPTAAKPPSEASLASSEKLFEKRRFWFVAP